MYLDSNAYEYKEDGYTGIELEKAPAPMTFEKTLKESYKSKKNSFKYNNKEFHLKIENKDKDLIYICDNKNILGILYTDGETFIIELYEEKKHDIYGFLPKKTIQQKNEQIIKDLKTEKDQMMLEAEKNLKELEYKISESMTKMNINKSLNQMITNADIDNIYEIMGDMKTSKPIGEVKLDGNEIMEKLLKQIEENNNVTKQALASYSDIIDNKINSSLEKVKQDNVDMWINSIALGQKMNSPEEIRKIIKEIPPVIVPLDETLQKIMNLSFLLLSII